MAGMRRKAPQGRGSTGSKLIPWTRMLVVYGYATKGKDYPMANRTGISSTRWTAILLGAAVGASVALASCGTPEANRSAPATLGKEYAYELHTHCGVRAAVFDQGRWWRANPPLDDGHGNPPTGWGNPTTKGTMVLMREDLAVFTSRSDQLVEFVPWPSGLEREGCT